MKKFIIVNDIEPGDIPWIDFPLKQGTEVFEAYDPYGVCTDSGTPITLSKDHQYPYFEIPNNYLREKI